MQNTRISKYVLLTLCSLFVGAAVFTSCSGDSTTYEEVEVPTQGLITTVQEIQTDAYKITDEQPVADTADSRIIANHLDNTSDTFTLEEARLIQRVAHQTGGHGSGIFTAASYGFMGFMLGRSMGSFRPSPSAYMDQRTYDRVNKTTGSTIRSTASKVRKPSTRSRSGYGSSSGRSTRSYGG